MRHLLFRRRITRGAMLLLLALLSGCSGFEALQPKDNEQILSTTNPASPRVLSLPPNPKPLPLPSISQPEFRRQALPGATGPVASASGQISPRTDLLSSPATPVANLTQYPYSAGGRSTFTYASKPGNAWLCTAEIIGQEGVLLTAGHCVWDRTTNSWIKTSIFQLQYNNGASAGNYDWECAAIYSGWVAGSWPYDYAFIKLRGSPPSGMDMQINVGSTQVDAIGYSTNYSTESMYHLVGTKDNGNPTTMDSTFSHGSSGGAWISAGSAVSINSFTVDGDVSHMHGPQFNGATLALYDFVRRGCTDHVHTASAHLAQPVRASPKATLVLTPSTSMATAGALLSQVDHDPNCAAGTPSMALVNRSSRPRIIGVIKTTHGDTEEVSADFYSVDAGQTRALGCINDRRSSLLTYGPSRSYRVFYDHVVETKRNAPPSPPPGYSMEIALIKETVVDCVPRCGNATTPQCMVLGTSYIPVLAPLAKLLSTAQSSGSAPDGALITKGQVVASYGGDPANIDDPCKRGDVIKQGLTVANDGLSCIVRASNPIPDASQFAVRMTLSARSVGTPSNWSPSLKAFSPGMEILYFRDSAHGATMEFEGVDEASDNAAYGGVIQGITAIGNNQLIVATSNGCVRGYYARP